MKQIKTNDARECERNTRHTRTLTATDHLLEYDFS